MNVDVGTDVLIRRPVAEVAAYAADPDSPRPSRTASCGSSPGPGAACWTDGTDRAQRSAR